MPAHMKKPHTDDVVQITVYGNVAKNFTIARSDSPKLLGFLKSLQSSLLDDNNETVSADEVFKDIYKKYGKVGATIRGFRVRDGITQKELAKLLEIHQVHVSQIENNKRTVGKKLAHKLAKVFHTSYRLFL
jgi:DNA-binding XRE family transcriptional regulator